MYLSQKCKNASHHPPPIILDEAAQIVSESATYNSCSHDEAISSESHNDI
jgi:hypothetical protein